MTARSRRRARTGALSGLLVAFVLGVLPARFARADEGQLVGDPPDGEGPELTISETLYREGRRLLGEKRYAEAAAKLAESYRLDPGIGTLLSLAICHEAQGKLATAWLEFGDAMRAAQREGRNDRVQLAREHLADIEPRLSRLTVSVDSATRPQGLTILLDGVQIRGAAEGVAVPIDPGPHTVQAAAPGKRLWSQQIVVEAESDQRVVVIRDLVDQEPAASPGAVASRPSAVRPPDTVVAAPSAVTPASTTMYVSAWVTLALLGGAVGSGIAYHDAKVTYEEARDKPGSDSSSLDGRRTAALRLGWLNAGLTAGAVAGAGLTTYLFLTRPTKPTPKASARLAIAPWVGLSLGGLSVASDF